MKKIELKSIEIYSDIYKSELINYDILSPLSPLSYDAEYYGDRFNLLVDLIHGLCNYNITYDNFKTLVNTHSHVTVADSPLIVKINFNDFSYEFIIDEDDGITKETLVKSVEDKSRSVLVINKGELPEITEYISNEEEERLVNLIPIIFSSDEIMCSLLIPKIISCCRDLFDYLQGTTFINMDSPINVDDFDNLRELSLKTDEIYNLKSGDSLESFRSLFPKIFDLSEIGPEGQIYYTNMAGTPIEMPLSTEGNGFKSLCVKLPAILNAIKYGKLVVIEYFSQSLHPILENHLNKYILESLLRNGSGQVIMGVRDYDELVKIISNNNGFYEINRFL